MVDLNDDKYRKLLADAGKSKDGKIIVEFLQKELGKIDYESIDDKIITQNDKVVVEQTPTPEQIAVEYKSIKKTREYLKKCLIYLIGR
jgi:hypothetical protein